jgi:AraC-like DNA-binding protein
MAYCPRRQRIFNFQSMPSPARCRDSAVYPDIDVAGRCLTVAARLRPGALPIVTGVRASELTDRTVELADLMGRRPAGELLDRMSTATSVDILRQMAVFLSSQMSCQDPMSLGVGRLLTEPSTVAAAAAAIGLGKRLLYARAVDCIGLAPKRALRITRLHRALWLAGGRPTWSAVVAAAGYADQAHLTREMQALLGEGPTDWARRGRLADSFKTPSAESH